MLCSSARKYGVFDGCDRGLSFGHCKKTIPPTDSERHYSERVPPSAHTSRDLVASVPVREPFNVSVLLSFLKARVVPGIEAVTEKRYRRRIEGDIWIDAEITERALQVRIPAQAGTRAAEITARLCRLFDVAAKPSVIDRHLAKLPRLAPLVHAEPGIRLPGVWDPFEGAVRSVLGQQVSVARATRLAGVLCERFGAGGFPGAEILANAEVAAIGLPGMRGRAISALARRVVDEGVDWLEDAESLRAGFLQIPGLGPWTAEYAAMRVGRDPDAFPDSDWGVVRALGLKGAAARHWAEPCRPWRAYAVMHLWCSQTA